jgi:hypothetical protein
MRLRVGLLIVKLGLVEVIAREPKAIGLGLYTKLVEMKSNSPVYS